MSKNKIQVPEAKQAMEQFKMEAAIIFLTI